MYDHPFLSDPLGKPEKITSLGSFPSALSPKKIGLNESSPNGVRSAAKIDPLCVRFNVVVLK